MDALTDMVAAYVVRTSPTTQYNHMSGTRRTNPFYAIDSRAGRFGRSRFGCGKTSTRQARKLDERGAFLLVLHFRLSFRQRSVDL